jgi:protein-disulfide isomerase
MSLLRPALDEGDHVIGNEAAPVTLVEFGDFQCPFCGQAAAILAALEETLGDAIRFAFRHFPLPAIHPHAMAAAEAAEAAAAQGEFWEMYEQLYAHQHALEIADLVGYARDIGLDVAQFERDLMSHRHRARVEAGLRSGALSGVNGTPTFFINGVRHDGSWDYDALLAAIVDKSGGRIALDEPLIPA